VQFILFLFGLVNAGVALGAVGPGTWAVVIAIATGKPLGVVVAVACATLAGLQLPRQLGWSDIIVVGCAAGIGFTVALFFATAAFPAGRYLDETKLGALLSVSSAGVAFAAAAVFRVGRFRVSRAARL
jgi:NhaA family Na+:H+ antiporter